MDKLIENKIIICIMILIIAICSLYMTTRKTTNIIICL